MAVKKVQAISNLFTEQINIPKLRDFIQKKCQTEPNTKPHYISVSFAIPAIDVLAALEQYSPKNTFEYYWEKPVDGFAMAAWGECERIVSEGVLRFRSSSRNGKELLSRVHHFSNLKHSKNVVHLFGGFSFYEKNEGKHWKEFGAASFTLPEWMIIRDGQFTILNAITKFTSGEDPNLILEKILTRLSLVDNICNIETYSIPRDFENPKSYCAPKSDSPEYFKWQNAVNKATSKIKAGDFDKVVLARELNIHLRNPVSDTLILNRLRYQYPDCYSFLIRQDENSSFIGCTPERLASFNGRYILTEGLAGSISRGKTASEDALLENQLLNNQKDLKEQAIVIEAIRENLTPYSDEVDYPENPGVKKLSNVQHLYTPIRAKVKEGISRTEVLKSMHPTPAVGGFPKEKAMPVIQELEDFDRGWYAAPLGWINANGDAEFVVAIRSGLIKKNEVSFFAGCGIVEASDPHKEWEETNLKFIPMLSALEYACK